MRRDLTMGDLGGLAERAADDLLIHLEPGDLRAWDFADELA